MIAQAVVAYKSFDRCGQHTRKLALGKLYLRDTFLQQSKLPPPPARESLVLFKNMILYYFMDRHRENF
jgi:hypothetical protein